MNIDISKFDNVCAQCISQLVELLAEAEAEVKEAIRLDTLDEWFWSQRDAQ